MTEKECKLASNLFEATRALSEAMDKYHAASRALDDAKRDLKDASARREDALAALRDYRPEAP